MAHITQELRLGLVGQLRFLPCLYEFIVGLRIDPDDDEHDRNGQTKSEDMVQHDNGLEQLLRHLHRIEQILRDYKTTYQADHGKGKSKQKSLPFLFYIVHHDIYQDQREEKTGDRIVDINQVVGDKDTKAVDREQDAFGEDGFSTITTVQTRKNSEHQTGTKDGEKQEMMREPKVDVKKEDQDRRRTQDIRQTHPLRLLYLQLRRNSDATQGAVCIVQD